MRERRIREGREGKQPVCKKGGKPCKAKGQKRGKKKPDVGELIREQMKIVPLEKT